jgi:hypothetical protein
MNSATHIEQQKQPHFPYSTAQTQIKISHNKKELEAFISEIWGHRFIPAKFHAHCFVKQHLGIESKWGQKTKMIKDIHGLF